MSGAFVFTGFTATITTSFEHGCLIFVHVQVGLLVCVYAFKCICYQFLLYICTCLNMLVDIGTVVHLYRLVLRWQWKSFWCGEIASNCNGGSKLGPSMNLLDLGEFVTLTNARQMDQQIFGAWPNLRTMLVSEDSIPQAMFLYNNMGVRCIGLQHPPITSLQIGGLQERTPKLISFQFDEHRPQTYDIYKPHYGNTPVSFMREEVHSSS